MNLSSVPHPDEVRRRARLVNSALNLQRLNQRLFGCISLMTGSTPINASLETKLLLENLRETLSAIEKDLP